MWKMCLICCPRKVNFLTFRPPSPPLSYVSPLTLLHHTCVSLSPPLPRLTSVQDSQGRRFWLGPRWEVSPSVIIFHDCSFSFCSSTAPDWIPQMSHLRAVSRPPLSVQPLGIRADEGLYLSGTSRVINQRQLAGGRLRLSGRAVGVRERWPQDGRASVSHTQWVWGNSVDFQA